ncbi:MAG: elongator complex protein 3 [Fusobacteriaceae bacterium]
MKHYNIPIFINHVGCPNSCVFCSQNKINGVETDITPEEVKKIIEEYLEYLPKESIKEVAFFGGTFTGISFGLQKDYLEVVKPFIDSGVINGIRLSTRPDCIDDKILIQLKKYGVTAIELGVQSLNQKVLDLTERNYPVEAVEKSAKLIKEYGIQLGIQLMIGLPGSTEESDYESAVKTVELGPEMARIYPTLVLSGTKMEKMYKDGEYIAITLKEAVERTVKIYSLLEKNNIKVIRVGLQPSEDLRKEGVIVAGPFHPAFRELVEGEIFYKFLKEIEKVEKKVEILANEKNISKIIGINAINKEKIKKLNVKIDKNLNLETFTINDKKYTRKEILKRILNEENCNK